MSLAVMSEGLVGLLSSSSYINRRDLRDASPIKHRSDNVISSGEIRESNRYFIPCTRRAVGLVLETITIWIQSRKQISWMQQRSLQIVPLTQCMRRLFA